MMFPNNYLIRIRAHKALRAHLPIVLVIALIASLPSLISSTVVLLTGSDMQSQLLVMTSVPGFGLDSGAIEQMAEEMTSFAMEKGWIGMLLDLASAAISPVLQLGLMYSLLTMLRGGTPEVPMAFARLSSFVKSVLLLLLIVLKMLLWALPGLAVSILGGVLMLLVNPSIGALVMVAGSLLTTVLAIRAAYSYAMANPLLADKPEMGVLACIRRSKEVMQGKRGQLFMLEMNYLLWQMLGSMVTGMFSGVIGLTLSLALQLLISVYLTCARCTFYDVYCAGNAE